jgi:hypothetical protein
LTIGDHDGDGDWDIVAQVQSGSRIRWFAGASTDVTSTTACVQPESSFATVGNWCAGATHDVVGTLDLLDVDKIPYTFQVGSSFGHVLAR